MAFPPWRPPYIPQLYGGRVYKSSIWYILEDTPTSHTMQIISLISGVYK
jgi:hypothetical protein